MGKEKSPRLRRPLFTFACTHPHTHIYTHTHIHTFLFPPNCRCKSNGVPQCSFMVVSIRASRPFSLLYFERSCVYRSIPKNPCAETIEERELRLVSKHTEIRIAFVVPGIRYQIGDNLSSLRHKTQYRK